MLKRNPDGEPYAGSGPPNTTSSIDCRPTIGQPGPTSDARHAVSHSFQSLPSSQMVQGNANTGSPQVTTTSGDWQADPNREGQYHIGIFGSTLTAGGNINIQTTQNESSLRKLKDDLKPVAAAYDSFTSSTGRRSGCFEGTRMQLLAEINDWVQRKAAQDLIYVLDGVAGIGKTTVAHTVAERAAQKGFLGASFFCSRDEQERATGKHFFTTIAFQLARHSDEFRKKLSDAVEKEPDIEQRDIYQQFNVLIQKPLLAAQDTIKEQMLVVIDALDECDAADAKAILTCFTQNMSEIKVIKFFITSRPEFHITDILDHDNCHVRFHLHNIEDSIVQADIQLYLDYHFSKENLCTIFRKSSWQPSQDEKEKLYGICGTLFIIASTAVKFILDSRYPDPSKRLATLLLGVTPADYSGENCMEVLDRTYIQILRSALSDSGSDGFDVRSPWHDHFQAVMGAIIVLQYPLPSEHLAVLLNIEIGYLEGSLQHLHSLIAPRGQDCVYQLHHKSFPDFITSKDRIQRALKGLGLPEQQLEAATLTFWIDPGLHHWKTTKHCFGVMKSSLHQNMCNIKPKDWYEERAEIEDLLQHFSIRPEVLYSCLHWTTHLSSSNPVVYAEFKEAFLHWVDSGYLPWIETLVITGHINEACTVEKVNSVIESQTNLGDMQSKPKNTTTFKLEKLSTTVAARASKMISHFAELPQGSAIPDLQQMVKDCYRFIQSNAILFQLSPMHIYWSALPFVPADASIFANNYGQWNSHLIIQRKKAWDSVLATLIGHSKPVNTVTFSPDGRRLASGSDDHSIRLWDAGTGSHTSTLRAHSRRVNTLSFSRDGTCLLSGSNDHWIRLWDTATGSLTSTLTGHADWTTSVAFSPDGTSAASGFDDHTIKLWDVKTGSISTLKAHKWMITTMAFSPDGSRLASADNSCIYLWDAKTGSLVSTLHGHILDIRCLVFYPDGKRLASGSDDGTVRVWNLKSGSDIWTLRDHPNWIRSIAVSSDGKRLASGSSGCTIELRDAGTGLHVSTLRGHNGWITSIAFSPDAEKLASGSADYTVRLWDAKSGSQICTLKGHHLSILSVAFSPDGTRLASASSDHTVKLWDVTATLNISASKNNHQVISTIFSPDGTRLALLLADRVIRLWDTKAASQVLTLKGHRGSVRSLAFASNGQWIASCSEDRAIWIWDARTGSKICILKGHKQRIDCISFSSSGSRLATGSIDCTIILWDVAAATAISTLNGHRGSVTSVIFSPDGKRLASGSTDRTVRLWDAESMSHISTMDGYTSNIAIMFSLAPDGASSRLTFGCADKTLKIWDATEGSHISTVNTHASGDIITSIASSSDGIRLVSFSDNKEVKLWEEKSGQHTPITISGYEVFSPTLLTLNSSNGSAQTPYIVLLLQRQAPPNFYGLGICNTRSFRVMPVCWFPPDSRPCLEHGAITMDPSGLHVLVEYKDTLGYSSFLLVDLASIELP